MRHISEVRQIHDIRAALLEPLRNNLMKTLRTARDSSSPIVKPSRLLSHEAPRDISWQTIAHLDSVRRRHTRVMNRSLEPKSIVAIHALPPDEDNLEQGTECMSHMQRAHDIEGRKAVFCGT